MKPIADFYRRSGGRDGHRTECKACNLKQRSARYLDDPEPMKRRVREWRERNPERVRAYRRQYRARPERKRADRDAHLRRKFGITLDDYAAMLARQAGGCAICGTPPPARGSLHVDHDHSTGDVRGLLCVSCNNALGAFRDSPDVLATAAEYVDDRDGLFARDELGRVARERVAVLTRG